MKAEKAHERPAASEMWELRLYVVDETPCAILAYDNLKRLCEQRLAGRYRVEVVDLLKHPAQARADQIIAVPTLVRRKPGIRRVVVGDLSNTEKVVAVMGM